MMEKDVDYIISEGKVIFKGDWDWPTSTTLTGNKTYPGQQLELEFPSEKTLSGWICPQCKDVNSPYITQCPTCYINSRIKPEEQKILDVFSKIEINTEVKNDKDIT